MSDCVGWAPRSVHLLTPAHMAAKTDTSSSNIRSRNLRDHRPDRRIVAVPVSRPGSSPCSWRTPAPTSSSLRMPTPPPAPTSMPSWQNCCPMVPPILSTIRKADDHARAWPDGAHPRLENIPCQMASSASELGRAFSSSSIETHPINGPSSSPSWENRNSTQKTSGMIVPSPRFFAISPYRSAWDRDPTPIVAIVRSWFMANLGPRRNLRFLRQMRAPNQDTPAGHRCPRQRSQWNRRACHPPRISPSRTRVD